MRVAKLLASGAMAACALPAGASAQSPAGGERPAASGPQSRATAFDRAYFDQFAPRSALDIARRVPGFNLDLGNTDVRGFAAAAGNVVINGARPSSKAESLETTLLRIPARRVARVELGPGDSSAPIIQARARCSTSSSPPKGGSTAMSPLRRAPVHRPNCARRFGLGADPPRGGEHQLSAGSATSSTMEGTDTITDPDSGELLGFRRKFNSYHDFHPYLSGSLCARARGRQCDPLNARWQPANSTSSRKSRPARPGAHDDSLFQDYDNTVVELGGDVTRPLAGGALKLVGWRPAARSTMPTLRRTRRAARGQCGPDRRLRADPAGRPRRDHREAELDPPGPGGFSFEAGGEAVLNTLDNATELFLVGEDGSRTRVDLPVDSAKVKETRGEVFVNAGRQLNPALRVDAGMRFEYSHLTVSGDATANRKLKFWKPSVTVDWKPGGGWHTQLSVKRTVAQLNFFDFVTVADLSGDRVNAGNQNLQPQRAWELRLTADRPILGDGLFKLDLGYDHISLLQDRV